MRDRRLDEVLEECLAAYLEGRRSIEDSLSLYPSLADRLEPLLRTAVNLAGDLQAYSPSPRALDRGRERFLESARRRRSALPGRAGGRRPSRASQWAFLGSAAAAALAAIAALTAAMLLPSGDANDPLVVFRAATTSQAAGGDAVANLQARMASLTLRANHGQVVNTADIQDLRLMASRVDDPVVLDHKSRRQLQDAVQALVQSVSDAGGHNDALSKDLLTLSQQVERLGLELPGPTATGGSPTPVATAAAASPTPTAGPSVTPAAAGTPAAPE